MSPERYQRIKDLFQEVFRRPPGERKRFLQTACPDDAVLRNEVHELLVDADRHTGFLQSTALGVNAASRMVDQLFPPYRDAFIGLKVGAYTIERLIGAGGMGRVYEARQEQPRRRVALKILQTDMGSRAALRRFRYEAEILSRLQHPAVAQVYSAGVHAGPGGSAPYFVMEYVHSARTITAYADAHGFSIRRRLELFVQVCDAVHHGHQNGIIHRDLKPDNILVDGSGRPKVIDFGVARATDVDITLTTIGSDVRRLIGTLAYMSPEQCAGDVQGIDTRSDVYSLGVVLYELICGRLPYDLAHRPIAEAARIIQEQSPPRASQFNSLLRGDLETILGKSLQKDPAARYQSAVELASDLRRWLNHEPIEARPPSMTYHLRLYARRNPLVVLATAATFVVLIAGTILSTTFALRATRAAEGEIRERAAVEKVNVFLQDVLVTASPYNAGRHVDLDILLNDASQRARREFIGQPRAEAAVRYTLARVHAGLWQWEEVIPQVQIALELNRQLEGDEHPAVANCLTLLGRALTFAHDREAVRVQRQAVELCTRIYGADDPHVAWAKTCLAFALWSAAQPPQLEESEQLYREALDIYEAHGTRNMQSAISHFSFAAMLMSQDRAGRDAEWAFDKALEYFRDPRIKKDRYAAECLRFYAGMLRAQERFKEELDTLNEYLALTPERLIVTDRTRDSMWRVAILCQILGPTEEAIRRYREALAAQCASFSQAGSGGEDRWHAISIELTKDLDVREIVRIVDTVLQIFPETGSADAMLMCGRLTGMARLLGEHGLLEEAEALALACLRFQERRAPDNHASRAYVLSTLGGIALDAGRLELARRTLVNSHRAVRQLFQPNQYARLMSTSNMITLYERLNMPNAVRRYSSELLNVRRLAARLPDATARCLNQYAWSLMTIEPADLRDPHAALHVALRAVDLPGGRNAATLDTLARAYHMTGQFDKAIATQEEAVSLLSVKNEDAISEIERTLASYYAEQSRFHDIETMHDDMLARRRAVLDPSDPRVRHRPFDLAEYLQPTQLELHND